MTQPFLDYACKARYPNLNKNLKTRLQTAQNKCRRFCLKLGDRTSIKINEFEKINWLPIHDRVNQFALSSIYKFHANIFPGYMNSRLRCSYQQLKRPYKSNQGLRALS